MAYCSVCGKHFDNFTSGRPKEYCSSECREFFKYKNALEKLVLKIDFDEAHKKRVRGDLFRISNHIKFDNNGTKSSRF